MRYEFNEGGSSKFWEIVLEGKKFRVVWGRIGMAGQTQTKTFKTAGEARAAHDKLVAAKVKKGYRAGKAKPVSRGGIEKLAALIEAYGQKITGLPGLELRPFVLKPSSAAAVASLERTLGIALPKDVRSFLTRGLRTVEGAIEEPFASFGFDFLDATRITEHTQMLRGVASDDEHGRVIRQGVALTFSEPELVLSGGAVYHFSFRNPLLKVARSFEEFLEHYLASGCFKSHDFRALWKVVGPHVPLAIPPAKNVWVRAYKKQFPTFWRS